MSRLFDSPLVDLLEVREHDSPISPTAEALVVRVAGLTLDAARSASETLLLRALSTSSDVALLSAVAELLMSQATTRSALSVAFLSGRLAVAELLEDTGGAWSEEDVLRHLGISASELQAMHARHQVLGMRRRLDRAFYYPVAQFKGSPRRPGSVQVLPGLDEVLATAGTSLGSASVFDILATPQESLAARTDPNSRPRSGFQALADGDVAAVVALMRRVVTSVDEGAPKPGDDPN